MTPLGPHSARFNEKTIVREEEPQEERLDRDWLDRAINRPRPPVREPAPRRPPEPEPREPRGDLFSL